MLEIISSMLEAGCKIIAVRVKTLEWFSLGMSPDGQMTNSGVATGWVTAGGTAMLYTRERIYCTIYHCAMHRVCHIDKEKFSIQNGSTSPTSSRF